MSNNTVKRILKELKKHAPFTLFGAATGIVMFLFFRNLSQKTAHTLFYTFHPLHVVLSAIVTASMYKNYKWKIDKKKVNLLGLVLVGFVGSIGIATISDSIIPFAGEVLMGMPHAEMHIGFIEKWQTVIPLAAVGIAIAYFKPQTKFPHAGHVLISTWASLFHMIMAAGRTFTPSEIVGVFVFLFAAVWMPCCISDIAFPLLFVGEKKRARE
ncbi:MAG: hypothetical protein KAI70_04015 [Candidatus Omnitrophica bacterium]|nr:hypothetical protein [Candidatus Omnitrophota bacterium]